MTISEIEKIDYLEPIEVAEGIYWVGYADNNSGLHCNPYLIVEGDQAVLIDGGSRGDFSTVMLKILRVGIDPKSINRLIYQHFDPDLCGNIPHLEAVIDNPELRILSHKHNNMFINYYSAVTPKIHIEDIGYAYEFSSGRRLEFILTPYSHAPGSFMTLDTKTNTLFTSDIFGSYDIDWNLYSPLPEACHSCSPEEYCNIYKKKCRLHGIIDFHKKNMNSAKALGYALDQIEKVNPTLLAPQHGSLIDTKRDLTTIISRLREEEYIGFDHFMQVNKL